MRTHYTTARSLIIFSFRHSFLDEIIPGVLTASRNRLGVQLQQPATLDNRFTVPVAFLSLTVDQLSLEISVAFFYRFAVPLGRFGPTCTTTASTTLFLICSWRGRMYLFVFFFLQHGDG